MKNKFKIIAVVLSLALIILCFAGCSSTVTPKEQIEVLDTVTVLWLNDEYKYIVGEDIVLNKAGQIESLEQRYETINFIYDAQGNPTEVNVIDKDDGTVGYEKWTYQNGIIATADYNANDGFRSLRKTTYEMKKDADGKVVELIERNDLTEVKTGEKSNSITTWKYEYDQNNRVVALEYYLDANKLDHKTKITYNENGKILQYKSYDPENGNVYLSFEFTYKMVDKEGYTPIEQTPFDYYRAFEVISTYIM